MTQEDAGNMAIAAGMALVILIVGVFTHRPILGIFMAGLLLLSVTAINWLRAE